MVVTRDGGGGSPFDMSALTQLLQELRIDHVVIAEITDALEAGVEQVEGYEPAAVPSTRFGTLSNGQSLGHHTELARQTVREAITTMLHDLQHYNEGVVTFQKGVNVADEHARADLDHITAQLSNVRSDSTEGWQK